MNNGIADGVLCLSHPDPTSVLGPTVSVLYGVLCHGVKQSGWLLYRIGLLYQLSLDLQNSQDPGILRSYAACALLFQQTAESIRIPPAP